jgi:hypothetical protein
VAGGSAVGDAVGDPNLAVGGDNRGDGDEVVVRDAGAGECGVQCRQFRRPAADAGRDNNLHTNGRQQSEKWLSVVARQCRGI